MKIYKNAEEIRAGFIKDGWKDPRFTELTETEARNKGYIWFRNDHKYFVMAASGNIFDERGKIVIYNIQPRKVAKAMLAVGVLG